MSRPEDESRTEQAWREIVEHYGERPVLDDEPSGADSADVPDPEPAPGSFLAREHEDGADEEPDADDDVRDEVPEVERFRPPPAPPFPRPRTWERGVAWAGIFLAPALALVIGLFSVYVPALVGWVLVAWFVGGFLYLVREMPRAPRDPWDDGSRI